MKLNDTARYLSLIRDAFEKSIVPDLQSTSAKGAAGLISNVLNDLLRREGEAPALLTKANIDGAAIAAEMHTLLQSSSAVALTSSDSYNGASAAFTALCADISAMGCVLAKSEKGRAMMRRAAEWEGKVHLAVTRAPVPASANSGEAEVEPLPKAALEAFLQSVHPAGKNLRVTTLDRMPGGFGKQTYLTDIETGAGQHESLVIRKCDKSPLIDHPIFDMEREFVLLNTVCATGYPAPQPLWFGRKVAGIDADFMVMKKMPGRVMGNFFDGPDGGKLKDEQVRELAELLARLHLMKLDAFSDLIQRFDDPALLTDNIEQYTRRSLAGWRSYIDQRGCLPSPLFTYLMQWLDDNVPKDAHRPVQLHGDFSIHNLLAENGRVTAVLDWEGAMFGAPELDLAFVQSTLSKFIDWDLFVQYYIECGGRPPAPESMKYYSAFYDMRVLLSGALASRNVQVGTTSDIRLAMFELGLHPHFMEKVLAGTAEKS